MKPSGIGGQAVIEGVMMKNKDQYAVAVRKPDKEIVIECSTFVSASDKYKLFKLPIFRGMLAFIESMIIGMKTLTFSASFFEEEEQAEPSKFEKAFSKVFKEKAESVAMGITIFISILLAIGIFFILPTFIAGLLIERIQSNTLLAIIEGCIRILIFISYVMAISQMKDIKRMFMYHGAEHKTINCLEHGFELTIENVRGQSKQHKRCGTSFMFFVMFVSIIFFIFIRVDSQLLRFLSRILLIPVIAGVSYEFIRFAGRSESKVIAILSKPGLWLQNLTTREPDDSMIEVAIQSVEAVFDWHAFLNDREATVKATKHTEKSVKNNNSKKPAGKANVQTAGSNKNNKVKESMKEAKAESEENIEKVLLKNKETTNDLQPEKYNHHEETAATTEKLSSGLTDSLVDEEEDDEILKALDRYLVFHKENKKED